MMVLCLTKYLLNDKNHLTKIWLAAHWEKKIKKPLVYEVDIEKSVQDIIKAEIIFDLRISGHLLVGIVKIHSRKTKYLLNECNSIFFQVKIFHTQKIDLPHNKQIADVKDITIADVKDITIDELFDNLSIENEVMDEILTNQAHVEAITLKETYGRLCLLDDTDMLDFSFREEDEPFDNFGENLALLNTNLDSRSLKTIYKENERSVKKKVKNSKKLIAIDEGKLDASCDFDIDSFALKTQEIPESIEMSVCMNDITNQNEENDLNVTPFMEETHELNLKPVIMASTKNILKSKLKKRKLSVDHKKCISYEVVKKQILDTSDITRAPVVAPVSKRLMILKETGCVDKLFCLPFVKLQNLKLLKLYQQNLKTHQSDNLELFSDKEESFPLPRKKCKRDSLTELEVNENLLENFDSSESNKQNSNCSIEINVPALDDDVLIDTKHGIEISNPILEKENLCHLSQKSAFNSDDISLNVESTQVSKTSDEKWIIALEGRLIQMLQCLSQLFQEKSVICFSSLVKNDKKIWVAQKFLSLLILKKFEAIDLKQYGAFCEVFISPGLNFDSACLKYCY